ncbi:unnamed protein product [Rotaria socialis]|uniref:Doublecortin domain-containing protein n=1 Tax=Rotaria socialis TaxID=392032 RepID=A0A820CQM7_9BILA|nr:unnamed protein product [Rotaria socialis]
MLPNSNSAMSYHTNVPTRFTNVISYVDFDQDGENEVHNHDTNGYPSPRAAHAPSLNRQATNPALRRTNTSLGVSSFSLLKEPTTLYAREKKQTKPLTAPIEEDYNDDDDVIQSSTESSPPTNKSKSTVTNHSTQHTSPREMSNIVNNVNNNKTNTILSRNDTYPNNKSHDHRQKTTFAQEYPSNGTVKRTNSNELLSPLNLNNEEEIEQQESQNEIRSVVHIHPNQSKLIPIIKYTNKMPSSTSLITSTGKSSSLKYSPSLNTPRLYGPIPSMNQSVQGALVRFFRNGDAYHHGVKLAVNEFELKSWEAFLNYLDRQPKLRLSTGGIKHIYTFTGQEIHSINQFSNRQSYVVASGLFIPTQYRYKNNSFSDGSKLKLHTSAQKEVLPYWNTRAPAHARWHSPPSSNDQIFVMPYSKLNMYSSVILNRNTTQTFEEWLQVQITGLVSHYTNYENITHLFGVTQDAFTDVSSFSKLFNAVKKTDTFIACTEDEYVHAKHYLGKMTPRELFTDRLQPRRATVKTYHRRPSKRLIENAKLSLAWIHGYNGDNDLTKKLYTLPENEILYVIGSICILYESKLKQQRFYTKHDDSITSVHVHQYQSLVASSEMSSSKSNSRALIHIWDHVKLRTITAIRKEQFGSYITLLSFAPKTDDNLILIISRDRPKIVLFVDWKRNELIYSITCKTDNILSVLFVFNTTEWIACISQRNLLFYHVDWSLRPLHMIERRESEVQNIYTGAAACDMLGERLLVGDKVGSIHVWNLVDNEPKLLVVQECILENDVETIVPINPDEFLLANGQNQIKIWNLHSNTIEHIRLSETVGSIQSICCIRQGSVSVALAIGTKANYIISKDVDKEQFDIIMRGHTSPLIRVCCHRNSHYFFSMSSDRHLFKWNNSTKIVEWGTKTTQPISCADLHPERNIIVLGTETSKLLIYDTLSSYYITTITLKINTSVKSVRFSPDGSELAVGLHNGQVYMFQIIGNGDFYLRTDGILHNNNPPVSDVMWSTDSKYLLVVYTDNDYSIWSIPSFELITGINMNNIKWYHVSHPIMCNLIEKSTVDMHTSVITLTPNLVLSCGKDGQLRLFRNHSDRSFQEFQFGLGLIQGISPSTTTNGFLLSMRDYPMNKRSLNDTVFGIQGVNPGLTAREDANALQAQQSTGKVVLKRQQLLACPYLQVDEQIKLLNLQKNCIVKIANLDHLTSLVVLDLCENEIDCIQGLDNLSSLRILRLANNKFDDIRCISKLTTLECLSLEGNPLAFTAAYEQIILSQSLSATNKQDVRQPMNIDQRIHRVIRMQHNTNNSNNTNTNSYSSNNTTGTNNSTESININRERRLLDTIANQQDSMSERSDTDGDSVKTNPPPIFNRTTSIAQQKSVIKPIQDTINPLLTETKINPLIAERSALAKSLVQSAMEDAFRKESVTIQIARSWPLLFTQLINESN